eukprot:164230_1
MKCHHIKSACIFQQIVLLIALVNSQSINPKSTTDQICISGSVLSKINGVYKYIYWDSDTNGSVYYNQVSNQYLYPWVYASDNKDYLISEDPTNNVGSSYCDISTSSSNVLNPGYCLNNFYSYNGSVWIT